MARRLIERGLALVCAPGILGLERRWPRNGGVIHSRYGVKNEILGVMHTLRRGGPGVERAASAAGSAVLLLAAAGGCYAGTAVCRYSS